MSDRIEAVGAYHRQSKHRFDAYAPGPGFLDWDSQPDPFRRFAGAPLIPLPLVSGVGRLCCDELYVQPAGPPAEVSAAALGLLFELTMGLSAWKVAGPDRWALRNNPSSGNLHPTEGYLLLLRAAGDPLSPGLYHYAPHEHALERRAELPQEAAAALSARAPGVIGALCFSSIVWREEWKYGARAFRYCQHDVGHALGAASYAARLNGWHLSVDWRPSDQQLASLLGLDRQQDFAAAEAEHPDLIAVLSERGDCRPLAWEEVAASLAAWRGRANPLSRERTAWPQIEALLPHVAKPTAELPHHVSGTSIAPISPAAPSPQDAAMLIRQRRSAQRMDGISGISAAAFQRLLVRTLPLPGHAPFDAFGLAPAINLLLFVHRVDGLAPGLYLLDRVPDRFDAFRSACTRSDLTWQRVADSSLPLHALAEGVDVSRLASRLSCNQGIAGLGAFSLGMIADFEHVLAAVGAWAYRRLFWEAGLIGQVLYLEAEAAGLAGTGIGCYFDDGVHELLGLGAEGSMAWQSLYHFTIGGRLDDARLQSEPAYAHLQVGGKEERR